MKPVVLALIIVILSLAAYSIYQFRALEDNERERVVQIKAETLALQASDVVNAKNTVSPGDGDKTHKGMQLENGGQKEPNVENDDEEFVNDYEFDCDLSIMPSRLIHEIHTPGIGGVTKVIPKQEDWLFIDWSRKSALFKWGDAFNTQVWFELFDAVFHGNRIYLEESDHVVAYTVPDKSKLFEIGPFASSEHIIYKEHLYIAAHLKDDYQGSENKDTVIFRKYNLDGEMIWEQPIAWPQSESGKYHLGFVAAYKNKLYYKADEHFIAAADAVTGAEIWRKSYPFLREGIDGVLNIDKLNGQLIVQSSRPTVIHAFDLNSGEIHWSQPVEPDLRPRAISDGILFLSYFDRIGIVAMNAKTGDKIWDYVDNGDTGEDSVSLIVAKDLLVFNRACTSIIKALDKRTGKWVWEMNVGQNAKIYDNALSCYDNKLIIYDEGIKIYE